ncbi:MAG: hypothetical protein ACFCU4_08545 [Puniceicoccaceae bacterium]
MKTLIILLSAIAIGSIFGGCATKDEDESTLPWSRPASWEGTAPGFSRGAGF